MTRIIQTLAEISDRYDALFVDLWGCVHDGYKPFPGAVAALRDFRASGGKVVLVTNAPRHRTAVAGQLDMIGVPRDSWDTIATSGDSARYAMFQGAVGQKVFFIGQPHDLTFFEPLAIVEDARPIDRVPLDAATGIVCTGPTDALADPSVWRPVFLDAKARGLKLLCANPDIVVDRGETREWCAGALAALYSEMGGTSLYFGKPWPPIYDLARRRLTEHGGAVDDSRILAIGDGIGTDLKGAIGEDLDCLFISGGLAAEETKTAPDPDAAALDAYLRGFQMDPAFTIGLLR